MAKTNVGIFTQPEPGKNKAPREPAGEGRDRLELVSFARSLVVLGCGETTISMCPALTLNDEATVALDLLEHDLFQVEHEFEHSTSLELVSL